MPIALLAIEVNGDFELELMLNDKDISSVDTIAIDPKNNFIIYLHISEATQEVVLHSLTMSIKVVGQSIPFIEEDLETPHHDDKQD